MKIKGKGSKHGEGKPSFLDAGLTTMKGERKGRLGRKKSSLQCSSEEVPVRLRNSTARAVP